MVIYLEVSLLAFCSDNPGSNTTEAHSLISKLLSENNENKQVEDLPVVNIGSFCVEWPLVVHFLIDQFSTYCEKVN